MSPRSADMLRRSGKAEGLRRIAGLKRFSLLLLALLLILSGCSSYADASVDVPETWAKYSVDLLTFKFEAGYTELDPETCDSWVESTAELFADSATVVTLALYESPIREQGTVDYLIVSCYRMAEETEAETLEDIMDDLNAMQRTVKNQTGVSASIEQNAKIRIYGEVEALTISYELESDLAQCMLQIGLVPDGDLMYQFAYADFTKVVDDSTVEEILSSLSIG